MTVSTENHIVGISVTAEFVEYCIAGECAAVVNSSEFLPLIVARACERDPDPTFVVEAAGGWESGIVRALQVARRRVSLVESSAVQRQFHLATTDEVDARAVCCYGQARRDDLQPAARVERVLSAFVSRPRVRKSAWQPLWVWLRKWKW